jgi:hypothetical protein
MPRAGDTHGATEYQKVEACTAAHYARWRAVHHAVMPKSTADCTGYVLKHA